MTANYIEDTEYHFIN